MTQRVLILLLLELVYALEFEPVTKGSRLQNVLGRIGAYGDFNADKANDILVLSEDSSEIDHMFYLWSHSRQAFKAKTVTLNVTEVDTVLTADFDGDGVLDILSMSGDGSSGCHTLTVHWCAIVHGRVVAERSTSLNFATSSYPSVIDANGDHVADLLVSNCSNSTPTIVDFLNRDVYTAKALDVTTHLEPRSSYYVDLNSDCQSDLIILGVDSKGRNSINVWLRKSNGEFSGSQRIGMPPEIAQAQVLGKLAFADMDGNGVIDAVVFSCDEATCMNPSVHILYRQKGHGNVFRCHAMSEEMMNFTQVVTIPLHSTQLSATDIVSKAPVIGDVNLDGLPDVITTARNLHNTKNQGFQPLLLMSTHCRSKCKGAPVTLDMEWEPFEHLSNITDASFFDLSENGILDVLMSQSTGSGTRLLAYRQVFREDHAFLKVLVLSGHCFSHCKSGRKPYGSMLPGATVAFSTTDRKGNKKRAVGIVHAGSSTHLPFLLFGLGEAPNFIEHLTVGTSSYGEITYHQWPLLVPNSQIIVIPRPPTSPNRWQLELYLTPSNVAYTTAAVLAGLFVLTACLVTVCQGREQYMDVKERKQAKHKFHFNAM